MNDLNWQTPLALVAVAAAAIFLARRVYRVVKGNKAGCGTGGCGSCGSGGARSESGRELPLVSLEQPEKQ